MEIRTLRYFLEAAREGNITRAAARLHLSQPTLSRQLKVLEAELGKPLFTRSNYRINLTEEGMVLRERAEDILGMVDKTERELRTMGDEDGGDIHIGCAESAGMDCFMQVVGRLQARRPRIRCHFHSSGTDAACERLDRGLLDFGIVIQDVDATRYRSLDLPHRDRWGLLMRRDNPLAAQPAVRLGDMAGVPLIASRQALCDEHPRWFGDALDSLEIVATYDLLYNAAVMARTGSACVLCLDGIADTGPASGLCFRPLDPPLASPLRVIWRRHQRFSPVAKLLLDALEAEFGEKG